ncbi:L,D-transpeptidase, partial [Paenibacillus sepulcri]|nr:L,D-transpeptidase [Paenibacillus sepulcri]
SAAAQMELPDKPLSIIVDQENRTLAVVSGDVIIRSYNVGLGGEKTPSGSFYISEKVKNPNGRDDGEFGSRGMTLSGTRYAIHGTDEPQSIGKDESHGCVRMNKEDVEELFDLVPLGTKVEIKSGVLPADAPKPAAERFSLQPMQDETNPEVVYRWLN